MNVNVVSIQVRRDIEVKGWSGYNISTKQTVKQKLAQDLQEKQGVRPDGM